jgi:WD40 repeat protein
LTVSCSNNKTVKIWDTHTGECQESLVGHHATVLNIVVQSKWTSRWLHLLLIYYLFSDGNVICTVFDDGTCLVCNQFY